MALTVTKRDAAHVAGALAMLRRWTDATAGLTRIQTAAMQALVTQDDVSVLRFLRGDAVKFSDVERDERGRICACTAYFAESGLFD